MKRVFSILAVLLVVALAAAAAAPAAAQGASRSYLLVAQNKLPNNLESQVAAIGGTVERVMGVLMILTGIAFLTGTITSASIWLLETFPVLQRFG